ncbi:MAG: hypothetical protein U1E65_17900 [Myxococcota bacterium]
MSRIPGVNPNAVHQVAQQVQQATTPVRDRQGGRESQKENGGKSGSSASESKSSLSTGPQVSVPPNTTRDDAGQQQQRGNGQGQGAGAGGHADTALQKTLGKGEAAMAQAAASLSMPTASTALLGKSRDSVLLNLGPGMTTFANGSLIPRKYARHYQKHTLGRYRDIWDEAESEDERERRQMTPEEYEAIVDEMTAARMNEGRAALLAMSRLPRRKAG